MHLPILYSTLRCGALGEDVHTFPAEVCSDDIGYLKVRLTEVGLPSECSLSITFGFSLKNSSKVGNQCR